MPKEFDDMVDAIKKSLKQQHPAWSADKISSRAYAIATDRWKKAHGGKLPSEEKMKDWRVLEFFVPIEENFFGENEDFLIRGVAINETTTLNNVKYVAEELEKAASSFRNVPILLDHRNEVRNIVGRTTERVIFNSQMRRIDFEGKIMDKSIQEMIKDGRIGSVSIGAQVEDLVEEADGSMKAIGIRGLEISLVAVPGDSGASLAQALDKSFCLKEMAMANKLDRSHSSIDEQLNEEEEKNMSEEQVEVQPQPAEDNAPASPEEPEAKEEPSSDVSVEKPKQEEPKEEVTGEKTNDDIAEMKKQISELASLLKEKKQAKEKIMEDKTKGVVTKEAEKDIEAIDNRIVETIGKNNFAIYRDYSKEKAETNLRRLVRR